MSAIHSELLEEPQECANCARRGDLMVCSRCHISYYCSAKCQRAYWPVHREWCKRNDFADALEENEPLFAKWMRKHGKQAALKDDEVERLEAKGYSNIKDMYGKANPKPDVPAYTAGEKHKMAVLQQESRIALRTLTSKERAWSAITVDIELGVSGPTIKWTQNQSHVEVFICLPEHAEAKDVSTDLLADYIRVSVGESVVIDGKLYRAIKAEESSWWIDEGVLYIFLVKKHRRGHYEDGKDNSHSFWRSITEITRSPIPILCSEDQQPPNRYYFTWYDKEDVPKDQRNARRKNRHLRQLMAHQSRETEKENIAPRHSSRAFTKAPQARANKGSLRLMANSSLREDRCSDQTSLLIGGYDDIE